MQDSNQKTRVRAGSGRPVGSLSKSTIKKLAIKQLESVLLDDTAPVELKTKAALRLTEIQ